jgi:Mrp family chromosome partitioning ATPase
MARKARGGIVLGVVVALSVTLLGLLLPATYESQAIVSVTGTPPPDRKPLLTAEQTVRQIALAPSQVTLVARTTRDDSESAADAEKTVLTAIGVEMRSPSTFAVTFRSPSAKRAQKGCVALVSAVVDHIGAVGVAERDAQAKAALDKATKELAAFVAAHPDDLFAVSQRARSQTAHEDAKSSISGSSDAAVALLRQERLRIEAELVKAQSEANSPVSRDNPYAEPASSPVDTAVLERRLVEIRNAIVSHQRAVTKHPDTPTREKDKGQATQMTEAARTLEADWKARVKAVMDAQTATAASATPPTFSAKVIVPPTLPSAPVKSSRAIVALFGVLLGAISGTLLAYVRAIGRRGRRITIDDALPSSRIPAVAELLGAEGVAQGAEKPSSEDPEPPPPVAQGPAPITRPSPTEPANPAQYVNIPRAPAVPSFGRAGATTQIGMMDPATLSAPLTTNVGQRMEPMRTVDVTAERGSVQVRGPSQKPFAGSSPQIEVRSSGPDVRSSVQPAQAQVRSPVPPPPPRGRMQSIPPDGSVPPRGDSMPPRPRFDSQGGRDSRPPPTSGEEHPNTQRLGSNMPRDASPEGETQPPDSELAMYRPDTTYSFVNRAGRSSSGRRRSEGPVAERSSQAPGPDRVGSDGSRTEPIRTTTDAPPAQYGDRPPLTGAALPQQTSPSMLATRAGWPDPRVGSQRPAARYPQLEQGSSTGRMPSQSAIQPLATEGLVQVYAGPSSWRFDPRSTDEEVSALLDALRDQLLELARQRSFVVAVTSDTEVGIAKSRVAVKLASMTAEDGRARVLLVEANFEFPAIHDLVAIEMPRAGGFSQQMRARIRTSAKTPWAVIRCSPTLDVLGEGLVRTPGMLFSREFAEAIQEMRRVYDLIIINSPMANATADHRPVDAVADGLVIVAPKGEVLADSLDRAAQWFKPKDFVAAVHSDEVAGADA